MTDGTLITVAPTGTHGHAPRLPVDLIDLIVAARECEALGASVYAVDGPVDAVGSLVHEVRAATDLILQVSSADPAILGTRPDLASCPLGEHAAGWHSAIRERGIVAVYEVTAPAQLAVLERLLHEHGAPYGGQVHVTLRLNRPEQVFAAFSQLPAEARVSVTGDLPVLMTSLALGGHLRVGMADTLAYAPQQPVESNMQLVARAVSFAQLAQRPPLTTKEARELLGVSSR